MDVKKKNKLKGCALVAGCSLLICLVVLRHYIFGGYYFISKESLGDMLRTTLPAYYMIYDTIFCGSGGLWTWRIGLGSSFFVHGSTLYDPFTYIVFLGGRANIPTMIVWSYVARIVASGIAFFCYIDEFELDYRATVISAVVYSFCGISIISGDFFTEYTILIYFPLICLGIERWLKKKKWSLFFVAVFLNAIFAFYYFFVAGIMATVYFLFRGIEKYRFRGMLRQVPGFIGIELAGLCAGAFAAFPKIDLLMQSPRIGGDNSIHFGIDMLKPYTSTLATALIRCMGLNTLYGEGETYRGISYIYNDEYQLAIYVSAFFFILLMQLFIIRKNARKRIIIYFVFICLIISIPLFSYVTNSVAAINYRWVFAVSLLQCVGLAFAVDSVLINGGFELKAGVVGVLCSVLLELGGVVLLGHKAGDIRLFIRDIIAGSGVYYLSLIVLWVLFIFLLIIGRKTGIHFVMVSFLVLVVVDVVINCSHMYDGSERSLMDYSEANSACYMDTSADIIADIMREDNGFYRINKDFDSVVAANDQNSCNDAMVQGYYGLKSYNSYSNKNYIHYLWQNDIYVTPEANVADYISLGIEPEDVWDGQELNYIEGVYDRYDLMSYLGVKYFLTRDGNKPVPECFSLIDEKDGIYIFENRNAYPLAFADEGDVDKMQEDFSLKSFSSDRIDFSINIHDREQLVSFTMPFDRDWKVYVDGKKTDSVIGEDYLLKCRMKPGRHEVCLRYMPIVFYFGLGVSFITVIGVFVGMFFSRKRRLC